MASEGEWRPLVDSSRPTSIALMDKPRRGILKRDSKERAQVTLVQAKVVDPTHLELSKPIDGPRGRTVFVSVAESGEDDEDRRAWLSASGDSLREAYGDSDPDYPLSILKKTNPDFVG